MDALDDVFVLKIYVQEVRTQSEFADHALGELDLALKSDSWEDIPRVFSSLQAALSAAAMVSKLLDPQSSPINSQELNDFGKARGRRLCLELDVDAAELQQARRLRNSFEHFDSRLDEFLQTHHTVVDQIIMPPGAMRLAGVSETQYLRRFDNQNYVGAILDREVSIRDLENSMVMYNERAEKWLLNHS